MNANNSHSEKAIVDVFMSRMPSVPPEELSQRLYMAAYRAVFLFCLNSANGDKNAEFPAMAADVLLLMQVLKKISGSVG